MISHQEMLAYEEIGGSDVDDEEEFDLMAYIKSRSFDTDHPPQNMKEKIPSDQIKSVICGSEHTFISLRDGRYCCFGDDNCGQLGLGKRPERTYPNPIEFDSPSFESAIKCIALNTAKLSPNWESLRCLLIAHEKDNNSIWRRVPIEIIKVINAFI